MPNFCVAYNCSSCSDKNPNLMFHKFPNPSKDEERWLKWVHALKRKNYKPSLNARLCSLHFVESNYNPPVISGPLRLKNDAVPSVFNYSNHLLPKEVPERRELVHDLPNQVNEEVVEITESILLVEEPSHANVAIQTTLTGIELIDTLRELRRDKKRLQQQLIRRNKRVSNMADLFDLYENKIKNLEKDATSQCYSDVIKQFCLSLHFDSPKAYDCICSHSILPDPSTICRWISTHDCKSGIFPEVIACLKNESKKQTI